MQKNFKGLVCALLETLDLSLKELWTSANYKKNIRKFFIYISSAAFL